jgi:uncharacterized phage protein (TIGR01671 family)
MNERSLFRGYRIDNYRWEFGFLTLGKSWKSDGLTPHIETKIDGRLVCNEIKPETVGQCTSKTDNKDSLLFEHDIVKSLCLLFELGMIGVIRFGDYQPSNRANDTSCEYGFYIEWQGEYQNHVRKDFGFWANNKYIERVGNIHDNPELLEEQNG